MLHVRLRQNLLCGWIIYCNTQHKPGTEKLFDFCCLCWQKPKPRLYYLVLDEWSLSDNYASRIWALGNSSWKSLTWNWIWIDPFISLVLLGFPVEGGLGREWMMAAWRGSWWESCWLPTRRLMSASAGPLPCSSLQAWSGDLSLSHQTISQVSAGACPVLSCSASSPEGLQAQLELGEDLWNSAQCPAWAPANFQITILGILFCHLTFEIWKGGTCVCAPGPGVFFVLFFTCGMNAMEEGKNLLPFLCLSWMKNLASGFYSQTSLCLLLRSVFCGCLIPDKSIGYLFPNYTWVCRETATGGISRMPRFVSPEQSAAPFLSFESWSDHSHNV